ncbi:hypothetical protein V6N11_019761 [Hibiscus sabdariffa]|uniref:Uncharacterized protein n=2 Tax=Hibiscus sabdariffa TaxID=183260 RepID=A0ABR2A4X5_9ROSI
MRAKFPPMSEMFSRLPPPLWGSGPLRGTTAPPNTRYFSRLWAAITIQEDTRNWKDKQTHPVDYRATSSTTQERDSLKSQGRGWPRGPTWRLGISEGNAKKKRYKSAYLPLGESKWGSVLPCLATKVEFPRNGRNGMAYTKMLAGMDS